MPASEICASKSPRVNFYTYLRACCFLLAYLLYTNRYLRFFLLPVFVYAAVTFDYRLLLLPSTLVSGAKTLMRALPAFIGYHAAKSLPTGVR